MCVICYQGKSETVDLNTDTSLLVDISDALSERDKVKFTVHTKVSYRGYYRASCVLLVWLDQLT